MAFHTFGPGLALDKITMKGLSTVTARVEDADTGEPLQVYTMDDPATPTQLTTNRYGYFPEFRATDTARRVRLTFGNLALDQISHEAVGYAADSLDKLDEFTISHVALDTDGQPYFAFGTGTVRVLPDTDGQPYYIPA